MGTTASTRAGLRPDRGAAPLPAARLVKALANGATPMLRRRDDATPAVSSGLNGRAETIEHCVRRNLDQYFADLDGAKPHALHDMVLQAVERPLLQFAMQRCDGNQSAAAQLLGINRNTLRKKLTEYGLGSDAK